MMKYRIIGPGDSNSQSTPQEVADIGEKATFAIRTREGWTDTLIAYKSF